MCIRDSIWFGQPTTSAKFERREVYEVCADLADRLGVKDAYTDGGKTREDWCRELYEEFRAENPDAPTWEEGLAACLLYTSRPAEDDGSWPP